MAASPFSGVYRDREALAKIRLAQLFTRLDERALRARTSVSASVYRRRVARASAGVVGAVGGLAVLIVSGVSLATQHGGAVNVLVLCASLAAVAAAYLVARLDAGARLRARFRALLTLTADTDRDIARLEEARPMGFVRDSADRLGRLSIAAPMVAMALLGPLSLHMCVAALPLVANGDPMLEDFGNWMAISAVVVGHAHLVLALVSWRYTGRLFAGRSGAALNEGVKALGWTVFTAAVPGILLIVLPPLITCATGLFVVIPTFIWAHRTASREHALLYGAS